MVGHHNICIGKEAGIYLTDESYMLCIKFEGFKEIRKQMTPEQYEVLNSFLSGLTAIPEIKLEKDYDHINCTGMASEISCPKCKNMLLVHLEIETR